MEWFEAFFLWLDNYGKSSHLLYSRKMAVERRSFPFWKAFFQGL